jgi:hypothetical protein
MHMILSRNVNISTLCLLNFNFFLSKKDMKKFSAVFFQFLVIKTLDPYPDPDMDSLEILDRDSMNPDPQH